MLTKIVGATLGSRVAKKFSGTNSSTGAMIGAAAPFVISRLSIPGMIVLGAGGYFAKRWYDKRKDAQGNEKQSDTATTSEKTAKDAKTASDEASVDPKFDPAKTRPNGAATIAAQPIPAGTA